MYSLGTDAIVEVFIGEPLKALMLLCRGIYFTQMLLCKPLKALMLWCRVTLFSFKFWDGKQNFVPNICQVVFANVSIEGRVVDSDVNGFFDGSGHLPAI